jgi:hypothetical protein
MNICGGTAVADSDTGLVIAYGINAAQDAMMKGTFASFWMDKKHRTSADNLNPQVMNGRTIRETRTRSPVAIRDNMYIGGGSRPLRHCVDTASQCLGELYHRRAAFA